MALLVEVRLDVQVELHVEHGVLGGLLQEFRARSVDRGDEQQPDVALLADLEVERGGFYLDLLVRRARDVLAVSGDPRL